MWRNYLTVGFRALARSKVYTAINVFGLTIGMAACILILIFVRHELSYDAWLPNANRTFQLQSERVATEEPAQYLQDSFYPAASLLRQDFPEIEQTAGTFRSSPIVMLHDEPVDADMLMADPSLFEVLQLPFARGDARTALRDPDSLVLTETEARRFFGDADPIGRTVTLYRAGVPANLRVTAVLRDLPDNTHLDLSMVSRLSAANFPDNPQALTAWNRIPGPVYVRLRPGADPAAINRALPAWEQRRIPRESTGAGQMSRADRWALHLENVRDVHLGRFQGSAQTPGRDPATIITFAIVALLILAIACVNFANLTTARASERAREVALRKVLGAQRHQLIAQFVGESILLAALAAVTALAAVELLLPLLGAFLDLHLHFHYLGTDGVLLPVVVLTLIVGAAGGGYPAFFLSRFQPATVLKAGRTGEGYGAGRLRSVLVIAQFAISIGLMVCTVGVYAQTRYAESANSGYRRDGLLVVDNLARTQVLPVAESLAREIARQPGVTAVGRTEISPGDEGWATTHVELPGRRDPVAIGTYAVDEGFFQAMGIRVLAGRTFSRRTAMDDATALNGDDASALDQRGVNVVLSLAGARQLGFRGAREAIGGQFRMGTVPVTIIGVVDDVRYRSAREEIEPVFYLFTTNGHDTMVVRFENEAPNAVMARIGAAWRARFPDVPFEASLAQDRVAKLYRAEQGRGQLFAVFAGLAIVIGCLGLYALAAFTAERRTKEIGIRKVLGARTRDIVRLLVWQFLRPVVIANLIAWPVAWWVMRDWLNGFEQRTVLDPTWFVAAGALALLIATATIVGHAVRVARANPIHALRYE
jgi:putative ABC transport system permease protein